MFFQNSKKVCLLLVVVLITGAGMLGIAQITGNPNPIITQAATTDIYVSPTIGNDGNPGTISQPVFSLTRARDIARTRLATMSSDINIFLRQGSHYLPQTLNLNETDSGKNGFKVVWQSYPGETAQISGGKKVPGTWSMHDSSKNIYKIPLTNLGGIYPRELFANGERMQRAWTGDHSTGANGINMTRVIDYDLDVTGINMTGFQNMGDVEVGILTEWASERCGVQSLSGTNRLIMKHPCTDKWLISSERNYSFFVENAYELINADNEWYYNKTNGTLYFKAASGVNPNNQSFVIPTTEKLLTLTGTTSANKLSNLTFQNLQFVYSADFATNTDAGYRNYQCHILWPINYTTGDATRAKSAVTVKNSDNITFQNNLFAHLALQTIDVENGASNINILNNKITDMTGGGIMVANYKRVNALNDQTRNITIKNNVIEKVAREYMAECGISIGFAADVTVESNDILDSPYTAIALWSLTSDRQFGASDIKNIKVTKNKIVSYMNKVWDGGGIYFRAWAPGSSVDKNCMDNTTLTTTSYGGWISNAKHGLYVDEGSKDFVMDANIVRNNNIDRWFSAWNTNTDLVRVTNNFSDTAKQLFTGNIVNSNNTVVTNGVYPTAAQTILNNCGLSSSASSVRNINENLTVTAQTLAFGQVNSGGSSSSSSSAISSSSSSSVSSVSSSSSSTSSSIPSTPTIISLKVNLGGAFNTSAGNMKNELRSKAVLPLNQPYNVSPYNYSGSESIPNINTLNSTNNIVDWALIEIKDNANNSVTRKAVLVRNDGMFIEAANLIAAGNNTNTNTGINLGTSFGANNSSTNPTNSYSIIIKHRNHIAIRTNSITITPRTTVATFDLTTTTGNNSVKDSNQIRLNPSATPAVFGLRAGDANSNGSIDAADRNLIRNSQEQNTIYNNQDLNLDANVDAIDRTTSRLSTESTESL